MATTPLIRRARLISRISLPGVLGLFCIFLQGLNWNVAGLAMFPPDILAIILFFWGIHGPRMVPVWMGFALGLVLDLLNGWPLGLSAIGYLIIIGFVATQRKTLMRDPFLFIWGSFGFIYAWVLIIKTGIFSMADGTWLFTSQIFFQWLMNVLLYPALHYVMYSIHNWLFRLRRFEHAG